LDRRWCGKAGAPAVLGAGAASGASPLVAPSALHCSCPPVTASAPRSIIFPRTSVMPATYLATCNSRERGGMSII
jgi:hypothetical protein